MKHALLGIVALAVAAGTTASCGARVQLGDADGGGRDAAMGSDGAGRRDTGRCVPGTCAGVGLGCGTMSDGCGGVLDCGPCGSSSGSGRSSAWSSASSSAWSSASSSAWSSASSSAWSVASSSAWSVASSSASSSAWSTTASSSWGASSTATSSSGGPPDAGTLSVTCNGVACEVPANDCCEVNGAGGLTSTCEPASDACTGVVVTCRDAADCAPGRACCFAATSTAPAGTMSCQAPASGSTTLCPSPAGALVTGQLCASSVECPTGSTCTSYNCVVMTLEACSGSVKGPLANACKPEAVCPATCTSNAQCQSTCPAAPAGSIDCCDTETSTCFQSASTKCPT